MVFGFHQKDKLFMILSISVYSILQQHRQWSAAVIGGFPMMRTHMNPYEPTWTFMNLCEPIWPYSRCQTVFSQRYQTRHKANNGKVWEMWMVIYLKRFDNLGIYQSGTDFSSKLLNKKIKKMYVFGKLFWTLSEFSEILNLNFHSSETHFLLPRQAKNCASMQQQ